MKNILYYACGGGLGHVSRTVALGRQLQRLMTKAFPQERFSQTIFTNTVFPKTVAEIASHEPSLTFHTIPAEFDSCQAAAAFTRLIVDLQPSLLIVDTFPRGVGGDLVELLESREIAAEQRFQVLVSRTLPVQYADKFHLGNFVAAHFDLVVGTGEPFGVPTVACSNQNQVTARQRKIEFMQCDPFLSRSWDELMARKPAAKQMNCDLESPIVLVVACGTPSECHEAESLFLRIRAESQSWNRRVQIRVALPMDVIPSAASTNQIVRHWPILELLPAVDMVIGSAGYNLFWETTVLNKKTNLMPRQRLYDDQFARANFFQTRSSVQDPRRKPSRSPNHNQIVSQVKHEIENEDRSRVLSVPKYQNGAEEAANAILQHWLSKSVG